MTRTTYPALCAIFFVHLFLRCTRLPLLTCFHHTRAVEACEVRVPRFPASLSVLPGGRRHVFFGRAREPSHGKENRGSSAQLRNRQKLAVQLVRLRAARAAFTGLNHVRFGITPPAAGRSVASLAECSLFTISSMASSCQNLILALKDCLKYSDCVVKDGRLPSDCLKNHADELPEECQALRKATFECKRGMVSSLLYV